MRRKAADQLVIQHIEADVESGFGLIDEARAYRASNRSEFSCRALQQASEIASEIERRVQQLGEPGLPFLCLLLELRHEIAAAEEEQS